MNSMTMGERYQRDGYLVAPGLVEAATVQRLRDEAAAIACGERGEIEGVTLGLDPETALKQVLAIHFPHKISPVMQRMLVESAIVAVLRQLIGPDIKCMQSMLFVKNAGKPGQAWHQDETFIPTTDASLIGVWIALDDATIDNGCLWVQPGSQVPRRLWPMQACADPRFDGAAESFGWDCDAWPHEGGVAAEVTAGSVVFFNGYTLHRSLDNRRASGFRRALVNHYMSAQGPLPWRFGNSRHAPEDYRDIVMVSGSDPFAERGLEDLAPALPPPRNRCLLNIMAIDLHRPYPLTPAQLAQFERDGFIKLKQVLSPETLKHYGDEITRLTIALNTQDKPLDERSTYDRAFLQVMNLWEHSETVRDFVLGRTLGRIAAELLQVQGVRLYHDQSLYKEPGGGITPAHADQYYWPLATDRTITAWVPLQPVPEDMGPLGFYARSQSVEFGRDLGISDESEAKISANMARHGLNFESGPFDLGEVSFHLGWTFHKAGANVSSKPRAVMTVIYMDAEMTLAPVLSAAQDNDRSHWCPGAVQGEVIATPKNPLVYRAAA
ncbi:hypothetical protein BH11PSE10_BH11PSE10_08340 [soil metagenome]